MTARDTGAQSSGGVPITPLALGSHSNLKGLQSVLNPLMVLSPGCHLESSRELLKIPDAQVSPQTNEN